MDGVPTGSVIRSGVIGGLVAIYIALVGLYTKFADLALVGEQVTLGRVLIVAPALITAYAVTRPRVVAGERRAATLRQGLAIGALAGLITGAVFGAAVAFAEWFGVERIREVFVAVTEPLIDFLTFGMGVPAGLLVLAGWCVVGGLVGGFARTAPLALRRPASVGIVAVILFGLLQRIVPIVFVELGYEADWLYSPITKGLTWLGGLFVFALAAGADILWRRSGDGTRDRIRTGVYERPAARIGFLVVLLAVLAVLPLLLGTVISEVLGQVMIYVLLGLGLNIVVGYAGLLDLGYVAFFAFGAYATGLLTGAMLNTTTGAAEPAISADLNFYAAVWIVMLLAAGVGLLIGAPVLRLRGDYLAIVTLGLGEIVSVITASKWAQPLIGGPQGMRGVSKAEIFGLNPQDHPQDFYYLALAFVLFALFVSWRLAASRVGRAWTAMREDEQVADAMGVSTIKYKLLAFAMGGAIGSLGGALFAVSLGSLTPASFEFLVSITALAVVILGGLGSLPGVVVGALVLIGLPGLLREFEEYRQLIYGGALVAIMILRPQGLIPNVRRSRELKEEEVTQDAWARDGTGEIEAVAAVLPGGALGVEEEDLE
ncbi:MAG TPA: leucine/isoleucine/valine transporter permease subunit [Actinomycetota bacterium]|nr:leucine/isoleucine/valine transporter permease subunit [Actinomycetota bacterium]